jgi:hypothetical protein
MEGMQLIDVCGSAPAWPCLATSHHGEHGHVYIYQGARMPILHSSRLYIRDTGWPIPDLEVSSAQPETVTTAM